MQQPVEESTQIEDSPPSLHYEAHCQVRAEWSNVLSVDTVRAEMPRRGKHTAVAATAEPTEDADSELETLRRERDAARDVQKQLKMQLKAAEE